MIGTAIVLCKPQELIAMFYRDAWRSYSHMEGQLQVICMAVYEFISRTLAGKGGGGENGSEEDRCKAPTRGRKKVVIISLSWKFSYHSTVDEDTNMPKRRMVGCDHIYL